MNLSNNSFSIDQNKPRKSMAKYVKGKILLQRNISSFPSVDEIQEGLECAICLDVPKSHPIYQCDNGHIFCSSCHYRVIECPMCGVTVGCTRNLTAEKIVARYPQCCEYSKYGCTVRLIQVDRECHQLACQYKPVACPVIACNDLLSLEGVVKHMDTCHQGSIFKCIRPGTFTHTFTATYPTAHKGRRASTAQPLAVEVPGRFVIDGHCFFGMCWNANGNVLAWVYMAGTPDEGKKYAFKAKIKNKEFNEKLSYTGQTISLHITRGQICAMGRCLKVDEGTARRFSKNDEITFEFKIRRK